MKIAAIATAALLFGASSAQAIDIGNTGINIGAKLDSYYDVDGEHFDSVLTPSLGYAMWGISLSASTDLNVVTADTIVMQDAFDTLPMIDIGASYSILNGSATAYGNIDWDLEASDFSGAKVGLSFAF
jgi:hypothetical protein